ncbi:MAG: 2-dehydropantoate 2-reductase, partial [Pseudomonadota bacterium]
MRIVILGAGGVGGQLAVRLALAGRDVAVLARGAHLEAIRARGLTLKTPDDTVTAPLEAAASAEGMAAADVVIFAVKGQDLDGAMELSVPLIGPRTLLLPFLNGVEAPARLAARFGEALSESQALTGIARISAVIDAPGTILQNSAAAHYTIGDAATGRQDTPAVRAVKQALAVPGVVLDEHADVRVALWEKFVLLAALAGTTAGGRCTVGEVLALAPLRQLARDIAAEVAAVARAQGVPLPENAAEAAV